MSIDIHRTARLQASEFRDVLRASGLGDRRPIDDLARLERMLVNSNLIVVAVDRCIDRVVGVARSVTDFAYCCYLSDLAVDRAYQGRGVGTRLIEETRTNAGPEAMCLLVSAPGAVTFYEAIGMPRVDGAFMYRRDR